MLFWSVRCGHATLSPYGIRANDAKPRGTMLAHATIMQMQPLQPRPLHAKACRAIATAIGLTVVLNSHWAKGAEATVRPSSEAMSNTKGAGTAGTAPSAQESTDAPPPDRYHLAIGFRGSFGSATFDTEFATMAEGYLRYQWHYGLGIAASYLKLDVANNESYPDFVAEALTLGPT
jgi:hypothetical protein